MLAIYIVTRLDRTGRANSLRKLDFLMAAMGALTSTLLWLGGTHSLAYWLAAFGVMGISLGCIQLRLLIELSAQGLRDVLWAIIVSTMGFGVMGWLLAFLSGIGSLALGVALPLVSTILLRVRTDDAIGLVTKDDPEAYLASSTRELILGPFACVIAVCFIYSATNILIKVDFGSFVYGPNASVATTSLGYLVVVATFVISYWLFIVRKHALDFYTLMKVPVALLTLALVLAGINGSSPLLQIFTFPTVWILGGTFKLLLVDDSQHGRPGGIAPLALGSAAYSAAYYLGRCLLYFASSTVGVEGFALTQPLCFILLGCVVATVIVTFRLQDHVSWLVFRDINNVRGAVGDPYEQTFGQRCASLAVECGLSSRETEVLRYIARGYSKPYIAERLCISDNTVRTHTRRIYEKLGVHSRRELQERLDSDGFGAIDASSKPRR